MPRVDPVERFWSKVDRRGEDDCWLWTAPVFENGYGMFNVEGKNVKAHRFSYELQHGPLDSGARLLHSCDTPACVNPAHLAEGTQAQNMADAAAKRRMASGERNPKARLTAAAVAEIKRRLLVGESQSALGREFGVAAVTVHAIAAGRTWRDVRAA